MTKSKGVFIAVAVALVVILAAVWLNSPAFSNDLKDKNRPATFDGSTAEVPLGYILTSSETRITQEERNRVRNWRGSSTVVPLASPGCKSIVTKNTADNSLGQFLFSIQVRATWCWRGGELTTTDWMRDFNVGDQWWNLYRSTIDWQRPVRTERNEYAYNRQAGVLQACAAWCFYDVSPWVSQTVRPGGSYDSDWKR